MKRPTHPGTHSLHRFLFLVLVGLMGSPACKPPPIPNPDDALIALGRDLFFEETFDGNGRTCGSCHPASNNFAIDLAFIATLPDEDPLFVAESNPDLAENFENPTLMREVGLILENQDGFGDLPNISTCGVCRIRSACWSRSIAGMGLAPAGLAMERPETDRSVRLLPAP